MLWSDITVTKQNDSISIYDFQFYNLQMISLQLSDVAEERQNIVNAMIL